MSPTTAPLVRLRFTSGAAQVRQALERIRAAVQAAAIDDATCDTAQIILAEVLNNVVEHAYRSEEGHPIAVAIWVTGKGLLCRVHDRGGPMPNDVLPAGLSAPIDASDRDTLPEGGFGWAMVRELTRDLRYFRADGSNDLTFRIPAQHP